MPPDGHPRWEVQFSNPQPIKPLEMNSGPGAGAMRGISDCLRDLLRDESGQDLIEYAMVAGLIGLGAVIAMSGLAGKIGNSFNMVGNRLTNST
jgi:pilus assembly protein Flp/PilA